ncbi:ATP-binding cassette domain-containing protein [bacterium]|nr:ATP-binding cassette domain-containing protein [bacterium]
MDSSDCGPAALLSVLRFYGGDAPMAHVRQLCHADRIGTSMLELVRAAQSLGFRARGAAGSYSDLSRERMPCIAHVVSEAGLQHFMVLFRVTHKNVLAGDPAEGLRKISKSRFLDIWQSGAVILLEPERPLTSRTEPPWTEWLMHYIRRILPLFYQSVFLGLLASLLGLLPVFYIHQLIDVLIPRGDLSDIVWTCILLACFILCRTWAAYFRQRFFISLNKTMSMDINRDFLEHLFRLPRMFFDSRKIGDIIARLNDSLKIQQGLMLLLNQTVVDGIMCAASFVLLILFSKTLAGILILFLILYAVLLLARTRHIEDEQTWTLKSFADVESSAFNSLKGIDDIIGFHAHEPFIMINSRLFTLFQKHLEKLGFTRNHISLCSGHLHGLFLVIFLASGAAQVLHGSLRIGEMMAAWALMMTIVPAVHQFGDTVIALKQTRVAIRRQRDILDYERENHQASEKPGKIRELIIENGRFAYPRCSRLLDGLNLHIRCGTISALWGKSGTGKSTIASLLQRKYALSAGILSVNGLPAGRLNLTDYRQRVAAIHQEVHIFNGSLFENIRMGRMEYGLPDIRARIHAFGAGPVFDRFDSGMTAILGEDGRKLSGGERQVVGLVRALLSCPDVLIVDEGILMTDMEIRLRILKGLRDYAADHAVLLITHDMQSLFYTDQVHVLDRGKIVRTVPPDLLFSPGPHFSHGIHKKQDPAGKADHG